MAHAVLKLTSNDIATKKIRQPKKNKRMGKAKANAGATTKGDKGSNASDKSSSSSSRKSGGGNNGKLAPATSIKVRHILCEKHAKIMEAMAALQAGTSFSKVP